MFLPRYTRLGWKVVSFPAATDNDGQYALLRVDRGRLSGQHHGTTPRGYLQSTNTTVGTYGVP